MGVNDAPDLGQIVHDGLDDVRVESRPRLRLEIFHRFFKRPRLFVRTLAHQRVEVVNDANNPAMHNTSATKLASAGNIGLTS